MNPSTQSRPQAAKLRLARRLVLYARAPHYNAHAATAPQLGRPTVIAQRRRNRRFLGGVGSSSKQSWPSQLPHGMGSTREDAAPSYQPEKLVVVASGSGE